MGSPDDPFDNLTKSEKSLNISRRSRQDRKGPPSNIFDRGATPDSIGGLLSASIAKNRRTFTKKDSIDAMSVKVEMKGTAFATANKDGGVKAEMEALRSTLNKFVEKEVKGY
tara:strand:+ start:671 stop:1006 length:336 start_codon:yes stop_codon:yes gene_type:complete